MTRAMIIRALHRHKLNAPIMNLLHHFLYQTAASLLSPAGAKARLSILIYHRVLPEVDAIFPSEATVASFDAQMNAVKAVFNVLPLPEAIARLKAGTLPSRAACITFDDGYADNYRLALPILQKHGLHATFFIATAYLNGGRMFNDTVIESIRRAQSDRLDLSGINLGIHDVSTPQAKAKAIGHILPIVKYLPLDEREATVAQVARIATDDALPNDLMMTTEELKALHGAGMEIGGHTQRHPIIAKLDDEATRVEIQAGKDWLESTLGSKVRVFAYPNGRPDSDYRREQARIIENMGFEGAVSTQWGYSTRQTDPYQLARFTPGWGGQRRFVPMLLKNLIA
jgi:peptidoglycan/xylan/chitin deacetylase (PgdA/CDA1 family)